MKVLRLICVLAFLITGVIGESVLFAGVSSEVLINGQDYAKSRTKQSPRRLGVGPNGELILGGLGSGATGGLGVSIPVADTIAVVNISTATTTLVITGVSGRHVRIGAINLFTAAANNVALLSGTGSTCGSGTAGMTGGTTAGSGYNFQAGTGIALGSGFGMVMRTIVAGDSVCIITSAAVQLSGTIAYSIY